MNPIRLILLILIFGAACEEAPTIGAGPLGLGGEERSFVVPQRSTKTVPGCMGRISLEVGDVEASGGVEFVAVIDHKDESKVATSRRLGEGDTLDFRIDGVAYTVVLKSYDATHLINDTATFVLRAGR